MRLVRIFTGFLILFTITVRPSLGQTPATPVELKVSRAESPTAASAPRLLPTDPELKDGNAAVVMLRMIWEQQSYMQNVLPKYQELTELPFGDPRIANELHFDGFERQLRRAAYMKSADWNYPLNEERFAYILLPDVQGLRQLAGRGLAMWTGSHLAAGDFEKAREGVVVQLACARHLARTPIAINRLVAEAIATQGLTNVERWIGSPKSPNLYWGLARLPDELGDTPAMLQWESESLVRSLPALKAGLPDDQAPEWPQALEQFTELVQSSSSPKVLTDAEGAKLLKTAYQLAREDLAKRPGYSRERLEKIPQEAAIMQWVLAVHADVSGEVEAAFSQTPSVAIQRLLATEGTVQEIVRRTGLPANPFPENGVGLYLATRRFDRRVKVLQTLEAIRDHAAAHGNLPQTLAELRLPAPLDPVTGQSFVYQVDGESATLRTAPVAGLTDAQQASITSIFRIKL